MTATAMVTARMTSEKKERGGRVLDSLGTNASQVINQLYDYVIRNGSIPEELMGSAHVELDEDAVQRAKAWLSGIKVLPSGNQFSQASDDDIRMARLRDKGHFDRCSE